jgi:hypothetical protein
VSIDNKKSTKRELALALLKQGLTRTEVSKKLGVAGSIICSYDLDNQRLERKKAIMDRRNSYPDHLKSWTRLMTFEGE